MRTLKISLLAAIVIGFASLTTGCKKTYTTSVTTDSVYSSGWLELATTFVGAPDSAWEQTITNSAITQAVVSDGIVLSYLGYLGAANDTVGELAGEDGVYTTFQVGSLLVISPYGDLTYANSGYFYRYVIVPGTVMAATKLTPIQLKSMSYTEITKALAAAKTSSPASITQ